MELVFLDLELDWSLFFRILNKTVECGANFFLGSGIRLEFDFWMLN